MNHHTYIAIEGPIGVGKTTVARILQEEMRGQVLFEVFEENPFLGDFYADRARYAFQTQIFFLLSRYRQQHETVARLLKRGPLFSDYLFAKDRLFAQLNLAGDELAVYEHVHAALGEQVIAPGLVIHLRATTDVLMTRIAVRDRPYERTMSRQYIDDLRVAYERFFADYDQGPVLNIDTTELNFVANADDRRHLIGLVRSAAVGLLPAAAADSRSFTGNRRRAERAGWPAAPAERPTGAAPRQPARRSGGRSVPGLPAVDGAGRRAGQPVEAAVDTALRRDAGNGHVRLRLPCAGPIDAAR
ncbi:MAG: deoxynucleoside kinase [Caldilineales bacterium]